MKYTTGNWHLDENVAKTYYPVYCNGIVIAEVGRRDVVEETKANAILIAAAPDLLEALKKAERRLNPNIKLTDYEENVSELLDLIQSAIKKATT